MYQIHKLCVLGVSLSFTILVKSQQPQCGVTRVFYLSLAADKLLMALLKGSRVVGQSRWGCWEGSVGRGNLGEPWAAEGGADGREAHISDHQVSSFWFFFFNFLKVFLFLPEGRTKGYCPAAMLERRQMDGICEKSLWQWKFALYSCW